MVCSDVYLAMCVYWCWRCGVGECDSLVLWAVCLMQKWWPLIGRKIPWCPFKYCPPANAKWKRFVGPTTHNGFHQSDLLIPCTHLHLCGSCYYNRLIGYEKWTVRIISLSSYLNPRYFVVGGRGAKSKGGIASIWSVVLKWEITFARNLEDQEASVAQLFSRRRRFVAVCMVLYILAVL